MDPRSVVAVLSEIAETASETLELADVFDRVAAAVRRLIPFDNMGVVRGLDGERAVVHAATFDCDAAERDRKCTDPTPLAHWSPRIRPRSGPVPPVGDAEAEMDPAFPVDAAILAAGVKSTLWEPFGTGTPFSGGVLLSSATPRAFTREHQDLLRPIAVLLGSAVAHWRIFDAERRRRERFDGLEPLFTALADSLDLRSVFERVSLTIQPTLPHDLLALAEIDDAARTFRILATAGRSDVLPPEEPIGLAEAELEHLDHEYQVISDLQRELGDTTRRNRLLRATGMRSWIRVPVRLSGRVHGVLGIFHRESGRFSEEDGDLAVRIADRIALALSHHRLAEKDRIAIQEHERAERLEATVETLVRELETQSRRPVIGASRVWKDVLLAVGRVASSETTVLITGESGTGKEVVARLLHQGSPRAGRPFVAINCAALPEQLLESELFGHERGAFSGAVATKVGRVEQAAGGTLFLDEIAEMSVVVQAKFLRVLQEREFQRVGGTRVIRADVRVVAATNRDLAAAIRHGQFRDDLYYRLNVFEVRVPALRERPEDILPLAEGFLEELGATMGRPSAGISRDARQWLLAYPWPGNVRELRNAIERAILLCDGGLITREHLPEAVRRPAPAPAAPSVGDENEAVDAQGSLPPGGIHLPTMDRRLVEQALRQARGNKSRAARLLGLTRSQLYTRLERYGLA